MTENILYDSLRQSPFFLIAGPCVIEDTGLLNEIACFLQKETLQRNIPLIFKSSYSKANRTAGSSFKGPGLKKGLAALADIKSTYNLRILTDIHETCEAAPAAEVADILQIPAFLCRQTDLLISAGKTGKIVNIKKGQFMAPEDMAAAAEKVVSTGNNQILLTERGSSFGYHNLIVDFRSFAIMQQSGYPVIYDVTHSLQKPSDGKISGGSPQYALMMAKAALATGCVNGLFLETHPEPAKAKSDAASMLPLSEIPQLLDACLAIINRE